MEPQDAARRTAGAIVGMGGAFMQDGATYARGAELGYAGLDFYVCGRGGLLGDTHADVVAAAFLFWNPEQVASAWAQGRDVQPPGEAAAEWVRLCAAYGEVHVPDLEGLERHNELLGRVVAHASPSGAPLFAGWRAQDAPGPDRPRARAQYLLNAVRELRGGLHGGAVLATGLTGREACAHRAPEMAPVFGWDDASLPEPDAVAERWRGAEEATNVAFGVALGVLDEGELDELVGLVNAVHDGWNAAKEA
jgi:hypothetical protein